MLITFIILIPLFNFIFSDQYPEVCKKTGSSATHLSLQWNRDTPFELTKINYRGAVLGG